jgi:hypothetical protein
LFDVDNLCIFEIAKAQIVASAKCGRAAYRVSRYRPKVAAENACVLRSTNARESETPAATSTKKRSNNGGVSGRSGDGGRSDSGWMHVHTGCELQVVSCELRLKRTAKKHS